jgi:microcystin-dependent protein
VTLTFQHLPLHNHFLGAANRPGTSASPAGKVPAAHRGGYADAADTTLARGHAREQRRKPSLIEKPPSVPRDQLHHRGDGCLPVAETDPMSAPFLAEIRIFGFSFPPKNWAFCGGQIIASSRTRRSSRCWARTYGGDGPHHRSRLPNLGGRFPMHWNQGRGLSDHFVGEVGGSETVSVLIQEMPSHTHALRAGDGTAPRQAPGSLGPSAALPYADGPANVSLNAEAAQVAGRRPCPTTTCPPT